MPPTSMFFEQGHQFCPSRREDRFLVGYFGEDLLDTTVYFYVICHTGDTIYRDQWPARLFLEEMENPVTSDSASINFIHSRMRTMLERSEAEVADAAEPDSIAVAPDLVSIFRYHAGSSHRRAIAYSLSEKAVIEL